MNRSKVLIFILLLGFSCHAQVHAYDILITNYTRMGAVDDWLIGSSFSTKFTNSLTDDGKTSIALTPNLNDINQLNSYDALILQLRSGEYHGSGGYDWSGSLNATEIANIIQFIDKGHKVLMVGEWGTWPYDSSIGWTSWDNQILGIVGGQYDTAYDINIMSNPVPIINNSLTQNVPTIMGMGRYGTANGGTPLFDQNFATIWGKHDNVLTILDTGFLVNGNWDLYPGIGQFGQNVSDWITTPGHKPVPEPATMLLLGLGLIGIAGARRKFKK